jgi:CelD/BcsL family acetyltransferase involved in cellulose biosynthesis
VRRIESAPEDGDCRRAAENVLGELRVWRSAKLESQYIASILSHDDQFDIFSKLALNKYRRDNLTDNGSMIASSAVSRRSGPLHARILSVAQSSSPGERFPAEI